MNAAENSLSAGGGRLDFGRFAWPGGPITELEYLTPTSLRVRLAGPRLVGLSWAPGAHVRVRISPILPTLLRLKARDSFRTYSVWDSDPDHGWIDLVLFKHHVAGAVGAEWAASLILGQYVVVLRDTRAIKFRPDANWYLFAGEETAAVAFASLMRAIPTDTQVLGVHQAEADGYHIDLPRPLSPICRHGAPAASSQQLVDAVAALDLPESPGLAYLAGEARTIQMVRSHLVEHRGWRRQDIVTKPFWTPSRRGMD
jgi:NADPH-dependent ferric siderophore reductase